MKFIKIRILFKICILKKFLTRMGIAIKRSVKNEMTNEMSHFCTTSLPNSRPFKLKFIILKIREAKLLVYF
jgi:hypothetical protein